MNPDIPGLIPRGNHFTIRYKNRSLYSDREPRERAEERAADAAPGDHSLVIVASPLLFYGVDTLLSVLPSHCHILCIEADEALGTVKPDKDLMYLLQDPRVHYFCTDNVQRVLEAFHTLGIHRFRRCVSLSLNGGYTLHAPFYRAVHRSIQSEIELFWKNRMTMIHMAPLWFKNLFLNLAALPGSGDIKSIKTNKPVFIAGAGESLEDYLGFLRSHRNSLYILSVDTALPALLTSNVTPDAVITLESQVTNVADFIGASELSIPLFCDLSAHPGTLRATRGGVFFFLSRFHPNRLFERMDSTGIMPLSIPPLGSVGVAAVYIALRITENRVFYAGLDFSFIPGKTHSRGTPAAAASLEKCTRLSSFGSYTFCIDYPGYTRYDKAGRRVKTTLILDSYRGLLSANISDTRRVFDAGRCGLTAEGSKIADFDFIEHTPAKSVGPGEDPDKSSVWNIEELERTRSFLEQELSLLSGVYRSGRSLLSEYSEGEKTAFTSALDLCDYLLLHFPDPERVDICDRPFIARVCAAAEVYIRRIGNALKRFAETL